MKANSIGARAVEEKRGGRFHNVVTQLVPRFSLREDVFGKALGAIAPVSFLDNLEHQLRQTFMIRHELRGERRY